MKTLWELGDEVRVMRNVRNDGTYPGAETGDLLIRLGSVGAVVDIGTFLQDQIIYSVHFLEADRVVGCREEELMGADEVWVPSVYKSREKVRAAKVLSLGRDLQVLLGAIGEVLRIMRDETSGTVVYHMHFDCLPGRTLAIPESALSSLREALKMIDLSASSSHPYLRLKLAQELFQKAPDKLEPDEQKRVDDVVGRQLIIEQRILSTPEAMQVILPPSSLEQSLAEVHQLYLTDEEFLAYLKNAGLDRESLAASIRRDLTIKAVLERVFSRWWILLRPTWRFFYLIHRERFRRPEFRQLKHILLTINDNLPGSDRATTRARVDTIRARLIKSPERFAEQALKHFEGPTAMNGGLLGATKRGQLFPELEPAAFALSVGELSEVLESPIGFHLMCCVSIEDAREMSLPSVHERIRQQLTETRRRSVQKGLDCHVIQGRKLNIKGMGTL